MSQAPNLRAALRVAPGRRVDLAKVDPGDTHGFTRESGKPMVDGLLDRLTELQERVWAEGRRSVLIVGYAFHDAGRILEPLAERMGRDPAPRARIVVNVHRRGAP